jgi:hypothetical protein
MQQPQNGLLGRPVGNADHTLAGQYNNIPTTSNLVQVHPYDFAQQPFDPISDNRPANLFTYRKTKPAATETVAVSTQYEFIVCPGLALGMDNSKIFCSGKAKAFG